ncbi:MAG: DUF374 domain-containing protein [Acidobacteria bacterium]|jgi:lysophospholipid acyltransferase (LPLAT)-like uncharacterized protein|nr:MAG: DUF374 domain-containing protein [Acidobacteriota bacterium]
MRRFKYTLIKLAIPLAVLFLRLLSRTVRWERRIDYDLYRGKIIALLHGNALCVALLGIDRGIYTMVSRFRDGDLADMLLRRLGFKVFRGSSEEGKPQKGGRTALLKLIEVLKEKNTVALTVDGPKGPACVVKEGVVFLAQKTGAPIVPLYVKFERSIKLNSWDRFTIPLPFSKAKVLMGKEIRVEPNDNIEDRRKELQNVLEELCRA